MARYNLLQKADAALVAYLISEGAGATDNVVPAKRSLNKPLPVTIVESKKASPVGNPARGIWEIEATVYVRTSGSEEDEDNEADAPATAAADRTGSTWDAFMTNLDQSGEQLGDLINAAASGHVADFTVQSCEVLEMKAGFEAKGDAWTDIMDLKLVCVAKSGA